MSGAGPSQGAKAPSGGSAVHEVTSVGVSMSFANWIEHKLFGHRKAVLIVFAVLSLFLGWRALLLKPDASFQKMVPASHPYIASYLKYENELRPLTNVVRIAVATTKGDIFTREYQDALKKITDEVFYIPGVDRGNLKSLWTPNVHWLEVTEEGLDMGPVIPKTYDGSLASLDQVRTNVFRSGRIGSLVANDLRSAVILVPLLETDPETGAKLDYSKFSEKLESVVRAKYESDTLKIHVTGFAKIVGDLIAGAGEVLKFFALTFVMTLVLLYWYSRCWRSTLTTIACCSLAVIWQLGIVQLLGFGLDPYSVLVPFLTFAIGVSHAVQNINTMATERHRGLSDMDAARVTFRSLFVAGSVALLCDAVGFSTLMVIRIGVIQELAISASIGVAVIILTKMLLLPVLMSYYGVSDSCLRNQARRAASPQRFWRGLSRVAEPKFAVVAVAVGVAIFAYGWNARGGLRIGDIDPGAPELRADSRYNKDVAFLTSHYSTSPDVFVVMAQAKAGECGAYPVAAAVERLQSELENVTGVEATDSFFGNMKNVIAFTNGGDLRWHAISRDRFVSNAAGKSVPGDYYNGDCSMTPVYAYLANHKADTLARVVAASEDFVARHNGGGVNFLLAAGNAGVEAATNIVVQQSEPLMLMLVYGVVALLVLLEFRSLRVTLAIMLPLYMTSVLCEALMAKLGLGVKVATLPVIALGVGIGVDYGIYIYNRLAQFLARGLPLKEAYFETLKTTGSAIALTGVALALGVATWVFSAIKFHADMGLLLTFMFLWNMVGAIVLIPALTALLVPQRKRAPAPPAPSALPQEAP
jgi:predicted RND superfamily exporter protein